MQLLIPIKSRSWAKQRMGSLLNERQRLELVRFMVMDMLESLQHLSNVNIALVTNDPLGFELAKQYNIRLLAEPKSDIAGLNGVLHEAVSQLHREGEQDITILHGDIPLIEANELQNLINRYYAQQSPALLIVPDSDNNGSNCLMFNSQFAPRLGYGQNSFDWHCRQAKLHKLNLVVANSKNISRDMDSPSDLIEILKHRGDALAQHTHHYLKSQSIDQQSLFKRPDTFTKEKKLDSNDALALADNDNCIALMTSARQIRDAGHRNIITYSRKVFIPLTQLCRDVCHYCTFAKTPKNLASPYLDADQVLETVIDAQKLGCKEVLFTLGERPEQRYGKAREALEQMGFRSTLAYLAHVAARVVNETGLLPHINAGCMSKDEMSMLRPVSASMGLMLESSSKRLCEPGQPHFGSPDKDPERRLETIRIAGELKVPFTTGILIGIGETRRERIESLLAIRDLHDRYGHIQEIIIQNFRAKDGTKMSQAPEPDLDELLWSIAVARLIFGAQMSIQAPPNLSPGVLRQLVNAGLNDWGGVSPATPDYVNPEAPWPHLTQLSRETELVGKKLEQRLTIYPDYVLDPDKWLDKNLHTNVLRLIDASGLPRTDQWFAGEKTSPPENLIARLRRNAINTSNLRKVSPELQDIVKKARNKQALTVNEIISLFQAKGEEFFYVCEQADQLRSECSGEKVGYVVNRNINYTNICYFKCEFCAFSKGNRSEHLRGKPYNLDHIEISQRVREASARGATEVCLQGGIHPDYTGQTYLDILKTVRNAEPDIHIHAFSPLEVWQGAQTIGLSLKEFLEQLKDAGLKSLPGTAAEVLDDEVRDQLCHDKITTDQWLEVMECAHSIGLRSTATIMFGHMEKPQHWANHLIRIRDLQEKTVGFTEFVPLPFVHRESPVYLRGKARKGPTFQESILMHAVARLVLNGEINNIQASWVKLGDEGAVAALSAGANDLGGTLMNESISRSAGASHGQEKTQRELEDIIRQSGGLPYQRSTFYQPASRTRPSTCSEHIDSFIHLKDTSAG